MIDACVQRECTLEGKQGPLTRCNVCVGPGPGRYGLPPTVGFVGHDFTKPTSPAYSFHGKMTDNSRLLSPSHDHSLPSQTRTDRTRAQIFLTSINIHNLIARSGIEQSKKLIINL